MERTPPIVTKEVRIVDRVVGGSNPPLLIAGPDTLESADLALQIASHLSELAQRYPVTVVFK